jgi:serine/threonine protein kinase
LFLDEVLEFLHIELNKCIYKVNNVSKTEYTLKAIFTDKENQKKMEQQILKIKEHRFLVPYIKIFEHSNCLCVVTDYFEKQNLQKYFNKKFKFEEKVFFFFHFSFLF